MRPEDIAEVTALVKDSGTSFYYGMKVLPAPRRDAMYALYAFCRVVDDIADEPAPLAQKTAELNDWRGRVADLYRGRTSNGLTRALQSATRTYDLQQADYLAIIDGMEMDAGAPIVGPDLATLDLYCDRVASAVGRHSVRIFGDSGPAAQDVAYALGRALQLTNMWGRTRTKAACICPVNGWWRRACRSTPPPHSPPRACPASASASPALPTSITMKPPAAWPCARRAPCAPPG
jgi:phytoene/squalene synthetase